MSDIPYWAVDSNFFTLGMPRHALINPKLRFLSHNFVKSEQIELKLSGYVPFILLK
jgi:hypothetical protein